MGLPEAIAIKRASVHCGPIPIRQSSNIKDETHKLTGPDVPLPSIETVPEPVVQTTTITFTRCAGVTSPTPEDHERKRRRVTDTPFPHQNPRTGYTAPVLFRGQDDTSKRSEDEDEEFQNFSMRRRTTTLSCSHTPVEESLKARRDDEQITALLGFSPLDSDDKNLEYEWMALVLGISPDELEGWSDVMTTNGHTSRASSQTVGRSISPASSHTLGRTPSPSPFDTDDDSETGNSSGNPGDCIEE
ncbi:hypothetical protein QBC41DRAFT_302595 [Cercophora samala]|uniref:Uncharacterized protein n=1 Tax=Cercophora samala TaxID=330535 RepID=A0AA40DBW2_9PEZI|nr:hypothetical protein QBC41DRAFT_302595 [Cercophora samala]